MKPNRTLLQVALLMGWLAAQNVGIGTSSPHASARLHVSASDRGLLIPNVALSAQNSSTPIVAPGPATSLLVYNTATAGTGNNAVSPGFYYWNGSRWVRLLTGTDGNGDAWLTTGNAGTSPTTNFLGTTDAQPLVVRTNNTERMRVTSGGNVGIGTTTPSALLHVEVSNGVAIRGNKTGMGSGYIGYSGNISLGTLGTLPGGAVMFAEESTSPTNACFVAAVRDPGSYTTVLGYSDVWIAGYFGVDNSTAYSNPPALYGYLNITNSGLGDIQSAVWGLNYRGTTAGNPGYSIGVRGSAVSENQDGFGVAGEVLSNSTSARAGGYFQALNYTGNLLEYARVADASGVNRKITGTSAVSEIIPTPNHGRIMLTAPEAPEYWYFDFGSVRMVNGRAHVDLDPILADIIVVNEEYPIRVFVTPVDMPDFKGVTVTNRTARGFDLVELNGGTSTGILDYQIVVRPKTGYGEGRFPQAPPPAGLKEDVPAARAKNQPDRSKIFYWPSDPEVYGYTLPRPEPLPVAAPTVQKDR